MIQEKRYNSALEFKLAIIDAVQQNKERSRTNWLDSNKMLIFVILVVIIILVILFTM